MSDRTYLGEAIASLRGRQTQKEVAERAGIDRTTWSQYEAGRRIPREKNLAKVLKGLRCTRGQLEEAMWRARRKHLLDDRAARIVRRGLETEAGEGPEPLPGPSSPVDPETDPLRAELRELLIRGALLVEELFFLLDRRRF